MTRTFEQAECIGDCAVQKMQKNEQEQALAQRGVKGGAKRRRTRRRSRRNKKKHRRSAKKNMRRTRRRNRKKRTRKSKKHRRRYYGGSGNKEEVCANCARVEASGGAQASDAVKSSEDLKIQAAHNNKDNNYA